MTHLGVTTIRGMDVALEEGSVAAFKQSLRGTLILPGDVT